MTSKLTLTDVVTVHEFEIADGEVVRSHSGARARITYLRITTFNDGQEPKAFAKGRAIRADGTLDNRYSTWVTVYPPEGIVKRACEIIEREGGAR